MLIYVPLSQIDDNPFQARQEYGDVADLAADIMRHAPTRPDTHGLQQVPTARLIGDDGALVPTAQYLDREEYLSDSGTLLPGWHVQLEFGHRRKRAFEHLAKNGAHEYTAMPLQLRDLTDEQMLDGVWSENRARRDLSAVEEAELLARKLERSKSQREVAEAWGVDRSTVANRLRLLDLPAEIQQANRDGRLSERACLALGPVVDIQQLVNGQVKWGKTQQHWGPPIAPADFILKAINDPKMTSDAIRDYAKDALKHAGVELPKPLADWPAKDVKGVVQVTCKGCPKRINTTCLNKACLATKTDAFKAATIAEAEEVLGIPFSDREDDFDFDYDERPALKALWDAGGQREGTNFVLGWKPVMAGFRPFSKGEANEYLYNGGAWEADGRAAIVIGHRGALPAHLIPADKAGAVKPAEDIPDKATRAAWDKEAKKLLKQAEKLFRQALIDALYMPLDDLGDVVQAFIRKPDDEWIDEHETLVGLFVEFMQKNSPALPYSMSDWRDLERLRQFLGRAGLNAADALATGKLADSLRRDAIVALSFWYGRRDYGSWTWPECHTALTRALDQFDSAAAAVANDEELTGLRYELQRALRDVEGKIDAKAAEEAERTAARAAQAAEESADIDILGYLAEEPQTVAEIAAAAGLDQAEAAEQLTSLALEGIAVEVYSGAYALLS